MEYKEIKWGWHSLGGINDIVGKTPTKIETDECEYICMWFSDGTVCHFYHEQSCCESVTIDDINGDFQDLVGNPILVADERINHDETDNYESNTWTFYTFRGIGGSVDVRWHGSSNGYYSESVNFQMIEVPA